MWWKQKEMNFWKDKYKVVDPSKRLLFRYKILRPFPRTNEVAYEVQKNN